MTNDKKQQPKVSDEILYQGHAVPSVLRLVYAVFLVWAVAYFFMYGLADLKLWLGS